MTNWRLMSKNPKRKDLSAYLLLLSVSESSERAVFVCDFRKHHLSTCRMKGKELCWRPWILLKWPFPTPMWDWYVMLLERESDHFALEVLDYNKHQLCHPSLFVFQCFCMLCVCVCVRERERERVYVCMDVCVRKRERERKEERGW